MEKKAAEELQHWIEQITTARLEITTSDRGAMVRFQRDAALGEEGYRIAIEATTWCSRAAAGAAS